jgi:ATP-binding cassette subfamily B protein
MTSQTLLSEFSLPHRWKSDRRGPVRWVSSYALHNWFYFLIMVGGAVSNAVLAAVAPVLIGQAFNAITTSPPQTTELLRFALLIALSQAARGILQYGRNAAAEITAQKVERDIRQELYTSLLGKSMTFHSLQPVGDIMARATNDVREVNFLFSPGLNLAIGSANFLIVPLFVAPRYHPALILTPLLFIIGYVLALWQYLHELNPITTDVRRAFGKMNTRLSEALDGIETVKSMAQEDSEICRFGENARSFRNAVVQQGNVEARFIPMLLLVLAQAGGLLHAVILFRQGLIDVGGVIAYFSLLQLFGFPTFTSMWAYSQVSSGISGARRILELINRENNLDQNTAGFAGNMRGEIEFRNVSFAYSENEPSLKDISFHVQPGQTVAVVGQTGSGKTSLMKLINRTYDTTAGQVLVDGIDVRSWNLETLRRKISIIEQDIFLFSRTVAENIAFGKPGASQEEIEVAAKAAQAHEFILEFKDGYQTLVGERGVTLSGGQRQRLALARAFLTDPSILVLDDSTSSIDSATEDKIQRAIYAAAHGRTTFLITHRLSQIRWADLIIVLRRGRIAAFGRHNELLQTSEAYRQIFSE